MNPNPRLRAFDAIILGMEQEEAAKQAKDKKGAIEAQNAYMQLVEAEVERQKSNGNSGSTPAQVYRDVLAYRKNDPERNLPTRTNTSAPIERIDTELRPAVSRRPIQGLTPVSLAPEAILPPQESAALVPAAQEETAPVNEPSFEVLPPQEETAKAPAQETATSTPASGEKAEKAAAVNEPFFTVPPSPENAQTSEKGEKIGPPPLPPVAEKDEENWIIPAAPTTLRNIPVAAKTTTYTDAVPITPEPEGYGDDGGTQFTTHHVGGNVHNSNVNGQGNYVNNGPVNGNSGFMGNINGNNNTVNINYGPSADKEGAAQNQPAQGGASSPLQLQGPDFTPAAHADSHHKEIASHITREAHHPTRWAKQNVVGYAPTVASRLASAASGMYRRVTGAGKKAPPTQTQTRQP